MVGVDDRSSPGGACGYKISLNHMYRSSGEVYAYVSDLRCENRAGRDKGCVTGVSGLSLVVTWQSQLTRTR